MNDDEKIDDDRGFVVVVVEDSAMISEDSNSVFSLPLPSQIDSQSKNEEENATSSNTLLLETKKVSQPKKRLGVSRELANLSSQLDGNHWAKEYETTASDLTTPSPKKRLSSRSSSLTIPENPPLHTKDTRDIPLELQEIKLETDNSTQSFTITQTQEQIIQEDTSSQSSLLSLPSSQDSLFSQSSTTSLSLSLSLSPSPSQQDIFDLEKELDGVYWAGFDPSSKRAHRINRFEYDEDHISTIINRKKKDTKPLSEEVLLVRRKKQEEMRVQEKEKKEILLTELLQREEESKRAVEVFPGVFLGGRKAAQNMEFIQKVGIKSILNVTREVPNFLCDLGLNIKYERLIVQDSVEEDITQFFDQACEFLLSDTPVMVHCFQGRSRSPTILIAYAIKVLGMSLKQAYEIVQKKIPSININEGFKQQLMEFEKQIQGKSTIEITRTRGGKSH